MIASPASSTAEVENKNFKAEPEKIEEASRRARPVLQSLLEEPLEVFPEAEIFHVPQAEVDENQADPTRR